jgi:undecaprenyl-diphosphatase
VHRVIFVLVSLLACALSAQPSLPAALLTKSQPASELSTTDAIVLGVIEGLTEFLPVSSTGHLIITKDVLHLNSDQPLFDAIGEPIWFRRASAERGGQLLTANLAADSFIMVIQFGAVAAVALVCWPQFVSMLLGLFGRDPAGLRLLVNLLIAFIPSAVVGLIVRDWVDEHLFSIGAVIFAQVAGAVLMFFTEAWYARRYLSGIAPDTKELSPAAAAGIGFLQCFAIWPGTSRPMMAIVGGYFAGLDPRRAAEFSLLLGFVTLTAASSYKTYTNGAAMIQVFGWQNVLLGSVVAAVVAALSIRYMVQLLIRHGLNLFAWYRIALAGALAFLYYN